MPVFPHSASWSTVGVKLLLFSRLFLSLCVCVFVFDSSFASAAAAAAAARPRTAETKWKNSAAAANERVNSVARKTNHFLPNLAAECTPTPVLLKAWFCLATDF